MSQCANPLLLSWVKEWLDAARDRNSKAVTIYQKAYDSLKLCPLPFTHPSEVQQLTGFGVKLCSRLKDRMKEYCEENGIDMPQLPHKRRKKATNDDDEEDEEGPPARKPRKLKPYVPALRSGGYALILALATLNESARIGLTKQETISLAEPHCDASFTAPQDARSFYTAWNTMTTLIKKDLVYEKGRPTRRYLLTEDGWDVAKRINKAHDPSQGRLDEFTINEGPKSKPQENEKEMPGLSEDSFIDLEASPRRPPPRSSQSPHMKNKVDDIIPLGKSITLDSSLPKFNPIILPPGSFTVELVLDVREIRAKSDRDYMEKELIKKGVKPIMRALDLGDVLWVAKIRNPNLLSERGAEGDEILLDYIVERKRLDDLISSIKDGRFHEQKFRLRKSGVKNVIYIIEEISMTSEHFSKNEEMVQTAIASMQITNGYFVKKTLMMDDTIRYLTRMTKLLKQRYEKDPLDLIPTGHLTTKNYLPLLSHLSTTQPSKSFYITYPAFSSLSSKSETLTLRDVYLKMLMCTRGVTGAKALEIQKRWKTPREFVEAYRKCGCGDEGRKRKFEVVCKEMDGLFGRKKVQKTLSIKIAEVWGMELNKGPDAL